MILEIIEALFILSTFAMVIYLVRHYIFTLVVLRNSKNANKNPKKNNHSVFTEYEPTVSILIPAHNEEHVIGHLMERMTELTYPRSKTQIIVVDDASSDDTGQIAQEIATKYAFIQVVSRDKTIGGKGKASAMNAGLKHATGEIVICFDADYHPQKDIVEKLVIPFHDPKVGAVQGRPVVLNESKNIITRLVTLERIGGFRVDEEARDKLGLIPQFGGTVGGFRRNLLEQLGGFDESSASSNS